jgi:hypothetical protein
VLFVVDCLSSRFLSSIVFEISSLFSFVNYYNRSEEVTTE